MKDVKGIELYTKPLRRDTQFEITAYHNGDAVRDHTFYAKDAKNAVRAHDSMVAQAKATGAVGVFDIVVFFGSVDNDLMAQVLRTEVEVWSSETNERNVDERDLTDLDIQSPAFVGRAPREVSA